MADALSTKSRSYYERSRGKVAYSIIVAAASMMLLGFCSESAGLESDTLLNRSFVDRQSVTFFDSQKASHVLIGVFSLQPTIKTLEKLSISSLLITTCVSKSLLTISNC